MQATENGSPCPEEKKQGDTALIDGVISNPVADTFPRESHSDADHLKLGTTPSAPVTSDLLPPSSSRHNDHLVHSIQNSPTGGSSGTAAQISPRPNMETGDGVEGSDTKNDGVEGADPKQKSPGQDTDNSRASMGM
jgi:hypothetical protein